MNRLLKLSIIISGLLIIISCVEKNPPRDEIPMIKNLLGRFEQAVREKNRAGLDSLIIAEAYEQGYHSTKILADIYGTGDAGGTDDVGGVGDTGGFLKFGSREFVYTKDFGLVKCFIISDTGIAGLSGNTGSAGDISSAGRPVEITLVKKYDQWYLKKFDLK